MKEKKSGPSRKNNLAPILSEKNSLARTKNPSPHPPEYQMDRALGYCFTPYQRLC